MIYVIICYQIISMTLMTPLIIGIILFFLLLLLLLLLLSLYVDINVAWGD